MIFNFDQNSNLGNLDNVKVNFQTSSELNVEGTIVIPAKTNIKKVRFYGIYYVPNPSTDTILLNNETVYTLSFERRINVTIDQTIEIDTSIENTLFIDIRGIGSSYTANVLKTGSHVEDDTLIINWTNGNLLDF